MRFLILFLLCTLSITSNGIETKTVDIHSLAVTGSVDSIREALGKIKDINKKNSNGVTALHLAVEYNRTEVVKLLLSAGANVNAGNGLDKTPLIIAVEKNRLEPAKVLLAQKNVKIDIQDINNYTAFQIALNRDNIILAKILLKRGASTKILKDADFNALHLATRAGSLEMVKLLLPKVRNIHAKSRRVHYTPLYIASVNGYVDIVRYLISKKVLSRKQAWDGEDSLHAAVENNRLKIVKLLLSNGVKVNRKGIDRRNALHILANKYTPNIVNTIFNDRQFIADMKKRGINLSISSGAKKPSVHDKLKQHDDRIEILKLLLAYKIDVNAPGYNKYTPLHLAVKNKKLNLSRILIAHGANIFLKDSNGRVPAQLTKDRQFLDLLEAAEKVALKSKGLVFIDQSTKKRINSEVTRLAKSWEDCNRVISSEISSKDGVTYNVNLTCKTGKKLPLICKLTGYFRCTTNQIMKPIFSREVNYVIAVSQRGGCILKGRPIRKFVGKVRVYNVPCKGEEVTYKCSGNGIRKPICFRY